MEKLVWTDDYSVGVAEFDEEHKTLFSMINRLIEAAGATTSSETVSEILDGMTDYARTHFRHEEELMEQQGFELLADHKEQHVAFRKKVVEFCSATMLQVERVPEALLNYLATWLVGHILGSDMKYRDFFRGKGVR